MLNRFPDRAAAGRAMSTLLARYRDRDDVVVLGLARGGMPPAFEVARALNAPLDVLVSCKVCAPGAPEFTLGVVSPQGVTAINEDAMRLWMNSRELSSEIARQRAELRLRDTFYRGDGRRAPIKGKTVILVDDGAATGATMRAATCAVRQLQAERVVAALLSRRSQHASCCMPRPTRSCAKLRLPTYKLFASGIAIFPRSRMEMSGICLPAP